MQSDFVTSLFNFAQSLNNLSLDDTELALFSGVVLLTGDRTAITDSKAIEQQQDSIREALRVQVVITYLTQFFSFFSFVFAVNSIHTINLYISFHIVCV